MGFCYFLFLFHWLGVCWLCTESVRLKQTHIMNTILIVGCIASLTLGFLFCLVWRKIEEERLVRKIYSLEHLVRQFEGQVEERSDYITKCYAGVLLKRFNKMVEDGASEHKLKCFISNFIISTEMLAFEGEDYVISFASFRDEIYEVLMDR